MTHSKIDLRKQFKNMNNIINNGKIKNFGPKSNLFLQVKWTPAKYLMADWLMA
jgi:hypothetical protein